MAKKSKARYAPAPATITIPLARVIAAKLYSSAGSGFMYTLRRPRTAPKFELNKFDPLGISRALQPLPNGPVCLVNQHVLFTETKPAPVDVNAKK
jgi:ribosomal protein L33